MFWFGLILAVCFIPGVTSSMVPAQWAVLSAILPLGLWRSGAFGLGHLVGLGAIAWATLSLLWAPNTWDGFYGLWLLSICGLSFWLGSTLPDLRQLLKGLSVGLAINVVVAITQALGNYWVPFLERPAGLFFNPTVLSAICALVLIALVSARLWWWTLSPALGLVLSGSRGGFFVLG